MEFTVEYLYFHEMDGNPSLFVKFLWVPPSLYAQSQKVIPVILQYSVCLLFTGVCCEVLLWNFSHVFVPVFKTFWSWSIIFGLGIRGAQLVSKNCPRGQGIYSSDGRVFD